jgi:hypothetical protein
MSWGWGRAGSGFLALAGCALGVIGCRRAAHNQGHNQNEPEPKEFLLHIDLLQPAGLPARPE